MKKPNTNNGKKMKNNQMVRNIKIADGFWTPVQNRIINDVLPYLADVFEDKLPAVEKSHAMENFRIAAGDTKGEFYGMVFQDSDVAKWLEAAAYALGICSNEALDKKADEIITLIGRAQEPDGYLNTYFSIKEPDHKWQNLLECHELYCNGHMIEAAVAYYQATGKDSFLNIMRRTADLICRRFGAGKIRGIPGHQEIELALFRLYQATGDKKYLQTALYFLDERGKDPSYFAEELSARDWFHWNNNPENREYAQNHAPVREQKQAVGHCVRAVYMYTAMAAAAAETGDESLFAACRTLWRNIVNKRMYITGGIGSTHDGESFTIDYDLPNDTVYAETCASIAMVFFARQMIEIEPLGEYADIMEKELYNGVLSGMQLDGKSFFYVNPLEVVPGISGKLSGYKHVLPERQKWYGCACCPPNAARLFSSIGHYAWSENEQGIFNHLYLGGSVTFQCAGGMQINCVSDYPWEGNIRYELHSVNENADFFFAVRIPAWCKKWNLAVNGEAADAEIKNGYAYIKRKWQNGDVITLTLDMNVRRMYAKTSIRADAGCVALMRGPLVYCFEECDNGAGLSAVRLVRSSAIFQEKTQISSVDNIIVLKAEGLRMESNDALYSDEPAQSKTVTLCAVPYFAWGNRKPGEMRVWLLESY